MKEEWLQEASGGLSASELKNFKNSIAKLWAAPFSMKDFTNLVHEMTEAQKRRFQSLLNIKLKAPVNRPFPVDGFLQLVRMRLHKPNEKLHILQSIMLHIIPIYEDDLHKSDEEFLAMEHDKREQYGAWHYLWALRLYPKPSDRIAERLSELEQTLPPPAVTAASRTPSEPDQQERQRAADAKERQLLAQERERRIKAEQVIDGLNKTARLTEAKLQRMADAQDQLQRANQELEQQRLELLQRIEHERKRIAQLEYEQGQLNAEVKKLQAAIQDLEEREIRTAAAFVREKAALKQQIDLARSPSASADQLIAHLYDEALSLMNMLRQRAWPRQEQAEKRQDMAYMLDLAGRIETLFDPPEAPEAQPDKSNPTNHSSRPAVEDKFTDEAAISLDLEPLAPIHEESPSPSADEKPKRSGTFYRKDHGGYVQLEDGGFFRVTESVVNAIGLEHEAEVECELQRRPDGSTYQHITILFQGDDAFAPMEQYLGYVELGERHTYYCVDIHNPDNRFPLHERDIEIQRPFDGDPCVFNVAADGEYARLSKLFSDQAELKNGREEAALRKRSTPDKRKKASKAVDPFLEGCKVAVIGGQAKWFESVVRETGAEFVHENGEHPERMFAELRKCHALFKLYTATSHEAIWSGVEIAKSNGIPHFMIEGSKSNLRKLLWDNRDLILSKAGS